VKILCIQNLFVRHQETWSMSASSDEMAFITYYWDLYQRGNGIKGTAMPGWIKESQHSMEILLTTDQKRRSSHWTLADSIYTFTKCIYHKFISPSTDHGHRASHWTSADSTHIFTKSTRNLASLCFIKDMKHCHLHRERRKTRILLQISPVCNFQCAYQ